MSLWMGKYHFIKFNYITTQDRPLWLGFCLTWLQPEQHGATLKVCYALNVVWGLSILMISSLHNNFHLLETEEKSPEVGVCLPMWRGNWKQAHTQSSHPIWVILGVFSSGTQQQQHLSQMVLRACVLGSALAWFVCESFTGNMVVEPPVALLHTLWCHQHGLAVLPASPL